MKTLATVISLVWLICTGINSKPRSESRIIYRDDFKNFNHGFWKKMNHTFSNNLANFNYQNSYVKNGTLFLKVAISKHSAKGYTASEIRSANSFKYGRFTIRMKACNTKGIVSAFFLYSPGKEPNPEIDIEFTGKNTSVLHLNYYMNKVSHHKVIALDFDAAKEFHEYSIVWLADEIRWEIDGEEVFSANKSVPQEPMQLLMSTWPSKSAGWAGELNKANLPGLSEIDYVQIEAF